MTSVELRLERVRAWVKRARRSWWARTRRAADDVDGVCLDVEVLQRRLDSCAIVAEVEVRSALVKENDALRDELIEEKEARACMERVASRAVDEAAKIFNTSQKFVSMYERAVRERDEARAVLSRIYGSYREGV